MKLLPAVIIVLAMYIIGGWWKGWPWDWTLGWPLTFAICMLVLRSHDSRNQTRDPV